MKYLSLLLMLWPCIAKADPARSLLAPKAPLSLLENKGQIKDQYGRCRADIDYVIHDNGVNLFLNAKGLSYQWSRETKDVTEFCRVDAELVDANTAAPAKAIGKQRYYERYYHPSFGPDGAIAHSYSKVIYRNVYPNIDRVIYVNNGKLEYDFVVREGGKVEDIVIAYKGVKELLIDDNGNLSLKTKMGEALEMAPACYAANGDKIETNYELRDGKLSFKTNNNRPLTIDPVLQWSTYYGGSSQEMGFSYLSYDPAGYVYLAATTKSTNNIATTGSYQETRSQIGNNNTTNAFIVKFDTNGVRLWATYYSGELSSSAYNIIADAMGYIYVCGGTDCLTGMATSGTYQTTKGSGQGSDVFIAKFTGAGARVWSTYFGGGGQEQAYGIDLDEQGYFYITGYTQSEDSIATLGAHQTVYGNPGLSNAYDGFLAKFDTTGNIVWSTYYGGEKMDRCSTVVADKNGYIYVCGHTQSVSGIATVGSHQDVNMSGGTKANAFLVKFNDQGVRQWATYYGDTGIADGLGLACSMTDVYLAGVARSGSDVGTPGSFQQQYDGTGVQYNAMLVKFSNNGVREWGTYFGGEGENVFFDILLDDNGYIYFSGASEADSLASYCSHQDSCFYCAPLNVSIPRGNGIFGIFNSIGQRLYSTYYGRGASAFTSLCLSPSAIYLGGATSSSSNISTVGAHQQTYGGNPLDCILTKFSLCSVPTQPVITGDTVICENMDAVYEIDLTASCYGASYVWSLPTGWSGSSTGSSIQVTANAMSGTITVTPYNVCGMAGPPGSLYVTVLPVVTTPVITLSGSVLSTGTYDHYQWYLNGNPISGATNQSYTATQQGTYTVQVWNNGTCDVTSTGITLGLKELNSNLSIAVYPNPTSGSFTLESAEAAQATVTDLQGRVVARHRIIKGKNNIVLPAATATGVYLLQYRSDKGAANVRMVKN